MDWNPLITAAHQGRAQAYAPYSSFHVGSAVLSSEGEIFTGCNVENQSYGLTVCAERVAVQTAVASGAQRFLAVVVVTETSPPSPPCGPCLSVLAEFSDSDLRVLLTNPQGEKIQTRLGDLLPMPFSLPSPR